MNESDRPLSRTHLLAVQEGVSEAQHREMAESRVKLVVPVPLKRKFPKSVRPELQTSSEFIDEARQLTRLSV